MDPSPIEPLAQDGRHLSLVLQGTVDIFASQEVAVAPLQRFSLLPFGRSRQSRHHLRPFIHLRSGISITQRYNLARTCWPVNSNKTKQNKTRKREFLSFLPSHPCKSKENSFLLLLLLLGCITVVFLAVMERAANELARPNVLVVVMAMIK